MDGIVIINKPKGCTSHDVVYKIKKITGEKVGHTGTLDPLATGVLPILVGKGTLCAKYLVNHDKTYEVLLQLGKKTSTGDSEGEVLKEETVIIDWNSVEAKLNELVGEMEQTPPIYSAIKVNGKKLYEYARKGQTVDIPKRKIEIYKILLHKIDVEQNQIKFEVSCSKGTYIRTLCEDIAKILGTIGYMKELNRIKVGEFSINQAIAIDQLEQNVEDNLVSIEKLFDENLKIEVNSNKLKHFLNGVKITVKEDDGIYKIYSEDRFIGIGEVKDKLLKRDVILYHNKKSLSYT